MPSLHERVLFACAQPVPGLQESSVHGLPSSQPREPVATQDPPLQWSPVVQAFPSLHGAALFTCTQPVRGSQESSAHGLPSSQASDPVTTQDPLLQRSPVVHAFPSLQPVPSSTRPSQLAPVVVYLQAPHGRAEQVL